MQKLLLVAWSCRCYDQPEPMKQHEGVQADNKQFGVLPKTL